METTFNKAKHVTDSVKLSAIPTFEKNELIEKFINNGEAIESILYSTKNGIDNWIDAFVMSDDFKNLLPQEQKTTMHNYRALKFILEEAQEFIEQKQLGEYNLAGYI